MTALRFVRSAYNYILRESGFESRLFSNNIRIITVKPGQVEFELDIKNEHTNLLQIIHGGTIASLVDLGGSLAVASKGHFGTGVSTDLNVSFLNPGGKVGDVLKAVAECDKLGKNMAYTTIYFTNSQGKIAARGSHTKYLAKSLKFTENYDLDFSEISKK